MGRTYYPTNSDSDLTYLAAHRNKRVLQQEVAAASISALVNPDSDFLACFTDANEPGLTVFADGTYTVKFNITSNPNNHDYKVQIYRTKGDGTPLTTIGESSLQTGTGLKTFTISGVRVNTITTDRLVIVLRTGTAAGAPGNLQVDIGSGSGSIIETPISTKHSVVSGVNDVQSITSRDVDPPKIPDTSVPYEEIDELIVLVKVTGTPATGLTYTDQRVLSKTYQKVEWDYHRTGGCGQFRLLLREDFPELNDSVQDGWEIHIRIRTMTQANELYNSKGTAAQATTLADDLTNTQYETFYRGVIRSVQYEQQGEERLVDIRGWGYIEQVNKVFVQKTYKKGLKVKDIVDDILDRYLTPYTRIIRPSDTFDPTNRGIDPANYQLNGDLRFECTAFRALRFLSELQGDVEWGVDAERRFYWRNESSSVIKNIYTNEDAISVISGGRTSKRINQIKVEGEHCGPREHLTIRGDVTDITNRGLYEVAVEQPWLTDIQDSSRWADNIIADRKSRIDWKIVKVEDIDRRIERQHPIPKIQFSNSADVTNIFTSYHVCKIHYIKGGYKNRGEIREIGHARQAEDLTATVLRAEYTIANGGCSPYELLDQLDELKTPIENLKSKWKQYRYPKDTTSGINEVGTCHYRPKHLDISGKIPGEFRHYHPIDITNYGLSFKDITNYDITNNPAELQDITNPRGILISWLDKQWTKLSIRRTFHTLPTRGKYIGEIISLIRDATCFQYGDLYVWSGTQWIKVIDSVNAAIAIGSGSGSFAGNRVIVTDSAGSLTVNQQLTANRIPYVNASGLLTDSANLTFDGTVLTALQYARIGTATDAATQGDFSSGLVTASRIFYDQSVPEFIFYNGSTTGFRLRSRDSDGLSPMLQSMTNNTRTTLVIMPKGTPSGATRSSFEFFGTDFLADSTNFERILLLGESDKWLFRSDKGGTGIIQPIVFEAGSGTERLRMLNSDPTATIKLSGVVLITSTTNAESLKITSATDNTNIELQATSAGGKTYRWYCTGGTSGFGQGALVLYDASANQRRWSIGTDGECIVNQWMQVGTLTDPSAQGDFGAGLTGAARFFYDQSVPSFAFYNSGGALVDRISQVALTETVFNDAGADIDHRIEGDTDTVLFFVDASLDRIGIGTTNLGSAKLAVNGNIALRGATTRAIFMDPGSDVASTYDIDALSVATTSFSIRFFRSTNTTSQCNFQLFRGDNTTTVAHSFSTKAGAGVVLNENGEDMDLRVEGDNKTSCLLLDASDDEVVIDGRFSLIDTSFSITGINNDYNPESTATNRSTVWRISVSLATADDSITGIANGLQGRLLTIINVGNDPFTLKNQNVNSAAANRIITGTGADVTLAVDDTAILWYDSTTSRWRLINNH